MKKLFLLTLFTFSIALSFAQKQDNIIDSILSINYFDYYDKEISVLLSNKFFAGYDKCSPIRYERTDILHFIAISFKPKKKGNTINKYLTLWVYPQITMIVDSTWTIDSIQNQKIKKIEYPFISSPLNVKFDIADSLIITNISINKTVNELFNKAKKGHSVIFFGDEKLNDDTNSQLNYLTGMLIISEQNGEQVIMRIKVNTANKTILDLSKKHWNLNKLKDVKIIKIDYL